MPSLTNRERDIIHLLQMGLSNRRMGNQLGLSDLTIRNYFSRLFMKFEVKSRTQLLAKLISLRRQSHKRLVVTKATPKNRA